MDRRLRPTRLKRAAFQRGQGDRWPLSDWWEANFSWYQGLAFAEYRLPRVHLTLYFTALFILAVPPLMYHASHHAFVRSTAYCCIWLIRRNAHRVARPTRRYNVRTGSWVHPRQSGDRRESATNPSVQWGGIDMKERAQKTPLCCAHSMTAPAPKATATRAAATGVH